ncbi:hypothetical protein [Henriciella litoralis]|uniref:hypothetical protein n=1 Tax=Henriciella litoralis TaxID=568102 RepID=UPI00389924E4
MPGLAKTVCIFWSIALSSSSPFTQTPVGAGGGGGGGAGRLMSHWSVSCAQLTIDASGAAMSAVSTAGASRISAM